MNESQILEWKSSWRDEYLKWICGFANAEGGVLIIGKNDDGDIVGVNDASQLLEEIPNKTKSLLGIVVDVNLKSERNKDFLEIVVKPHSNPISFRGEYHYRSGSTKQVLKGATLNEFLLRKHGRSWDDTPIPNVGMKELDSVALNDFRQLGIKSDRLPRNALNQSNSELIELLHLRESGNLRRSAVLLFHPNPVRFFAGAFIKIGYFEKESYLAYQDVIEGNLFTQVERSVDLLRTKYSKAEISYESIYRHETPLVPEEALREAVLNAIAHRDYNNPAPIQVRVYENRIALYNPGNLPPGWTVDSLLNVHESVPHNPRIANAFFRAGLIEAWGSGVEKIIRACQSAGTTTPQWTMRPDGLSLEFVTSDTSLRRTVHNWTFEKSRFTRSQPKSQPESLREKVLRQLSDGQMSKADISRNLGQKMVSGQLNKVIRLLVAEGIIRRTIPDKPGSRLQKYYLTEKGRTAFEESSSGTVKK